MHMPYQQLPASGHVPPPAPSLNGGLYTGQPFETGAPWANVPATPDAGYLVHYALRSANPPPGAEVQYPAAIRPGNSYTEMHGARRVSGPFPIYCADGTYTAGTAAVPQQQPVRFTKYSYL